MLRMVFGYRMQDMVNMEELREKVGMYSVNQLNCYHVLIEAFNIIRFGSSSVIQEKWLQKSNSGYSNRRPNDVKVPKIDHIKCQGFSWFGAKLWNSLPEEIKAIQKISVFKGKVKEYISNHIPSY